MPSISPIGPSALNNRTADLVPLIRPADLKKVVEKGPVIVELMNFGCPYCRAAMPELDRVAHEKLGKVKFAKVSLGDFAGQRLAVELGITMLPAFAVFHDGEFIGTFERQGHDQVTADFIRDNMKAAFDSAGVSI
jgi:thiol-disulfide isomerase/thioredoxin